MKPTRTRYASNDDHQIGDIVKLLYDSQEWGVSVGIIIGQRKSVGENQILEMIMCNSDGSMRRVSLDSYWVTGIDY